MNLLQHALNNVVGKAPNTDPLPVVPRQGGSLLNMGVTGARPSSTLQAISASSVLFSAIDKMAVGTAKAQWRVVSVDANGETNDEPTAPLAGTLRDLWLMPTPFYTRFEFNEQLVTYFALTGEMWAVKIRGPMGVPVALQPIRPDRMHPIPSRDAYIAGYVYTIGNERIPLDVDDVVYHRRPSPLDPYRGMSPVGSMLWDIGADEAAAQYTSRFFSNSAIPGGVIEVDEDMNDADFDDFVERWRSQHQGTHNAHRVAVLERAHWKSIASSAREMQFTEVRQLNRDIIRQAFGIPKSILGDTDDVNRANAEASEVVFSKWVIVPLLERLAQTFNMHLSPDFGEDLKLVYDDPTPTDRAQAVLEASTGYNSGLLTRDEGRALMEHGAADEGGDEFKRSQPNPFTLALTPPTEYTAKSLTDNPVHPDVVVDEAVDMRDTWARRLKAEAEGVSDFLERFKTIRMDRTARYYDGRPGLLTVASDGSINKLEPSDLLGYDWDWWGKYGAEVVAELTAAYIASLTVDDSVLPLMPDLQRRAAEWAEVRGATLLKLDGPLNLANATRSRVNDLVARAVEDGTPLNTLQRQLVDDFAFSPKRAENIARTETATALGQGHKGLALVRDDDQKRWVVNDAHDESCLGNQAQGWIPIAEDFQSGHDTIPAHPQCECNVIYRQSRDEDDAEFRAVQCPTCKRRLNVNLPVGRSYGPIQAYCTRCDKIAEL